MTASHYIFFLSFVDLCLSNDHSFLQTTITVSFKPSQNIHSYALCYKEYEQSWEDNWDRPTQSKIISSTEISQSTTKSGTIIAIAEDLNPGTTYCVRLIAHDVNGDDQGDPGPDLIIDTETVSCTPKPSRSCIIL